MHDPQFVRQDSKHIAASCYGSRLREAITAPGSNVTELYVPNYPLGSHGSVGLLADEFSI